MKELDLLKKHWNEQKDFPKVSKNEINKMIHKKSSSIVKWIFIISVIEFLILNLVSYFYSFKEEELILKGKPISFIVENIDYLSAAISVFFIILFYLNYKKISVADSTKKLIVQILKTKKTVNYYIYTNLVALAIVLIAVALSIIPWDSNELNISHTLVIIGAIIILLLIFVAIIWLYYKVVYGLLIKKLMKNYKELEKIDTDI
ncbi:hypothetical protein [Myroides pelagicus]|uniref:Beta-carotene 15,15'-monooxygenase n=1 Tax=Myroides pelagicus TaxID=270914 RepID=A0A7K1GJR7_9FLAO|nr:hypothetical protein [Myroides pelagicus]MEC4113887.1 hypothetical protein [Myroides pelagicus]MTH29122.1 hypothetical protein [Myroides pelagicus]